MGARHDGTLHHGLSGYPTLHRPTEDGRPAKLPFSVSKVPKLETRTPRGFNVKAAGCRDRDASWSDSRLSSDRPYQ
jgi:hypothetical protein